MYTNKLNAGTTNSSVEYGLIKLLKVFYRTCTYFYLNKN